LRAGGEGFYLVEAGGRTPLAFGLASLAAFRLVFEILIVEEVLLPRGKDELCAAFRAF
jgi:hypothetical protein